jgi:hypothetical protein
VEVSMTSVESKCRILGKLWMDYRDDPDFVDFIEYNDLGLPMAYLVDSDLVKMTNKGEIFVEETFELFLQSLGLEDTGFEDLEEVLETAAE